MKYNKLIVIAVLSMSLMACNQNVENNGMEDNLVAAENNVSTTNNETNNETTNSEEINETTDDLIDEAEEKIYYLPLSKNIEGTDKWGFINASDFDEVLIDFQYDAATYFDDTYNFSIVRKDLDVGIINQENDMLIDFGIYKTIYEGTEDILFAERLDGKFVIIDYKGNEYYETVSGEGVYRDIDGIIQVYGRDSYTYFDVYSKSLISLDTNDYEEINEKMTFINSPFEMVKNEEGKYTVLKEGVPFIDEAYDSISYTGEYFIVGNETDQAPEFYNPLNAYGLLDQDGYPLMDVFYYDVRHIANDYFVVAEFGELDIDYKQYSSQTYKKAIFNRAEAKTGFDYYITEYVKDSIFYVFDGISYYFLDVETGKKVMTDLEIEGPLEIKSVGDVIVFNHETNHGSYKIYANEEKILKKVTKHYQLTNGLVLTKFKAAGINPIFYPLLAFDDSAVEDKINKVIDELFDTVDEVELESDRYYVTGSIGFDVNEYKNILVLTQNSYWYGLGAAHGNYGDETFNFDLTTGDLISLKDLFKETVDLDVVVPMLLKEVALTDPEFTERLYLDLETLTDEEVITYFKRDSYNFYLSDEGLTIYYNPYDIGPYAAGLIYFDIPFELVDEHLNKDKSWFTN